MQFGLLLLLIDDYDQIENMVFYQIKVTFENWN